MRGVIFDWDGTLADSHNSLYEANAAVMRALDLPFSEELYREHYAPDWRLMYQRLGVPDDQVARANEIWQDAFHGTQTSKLLTGALEAVERLRDAAIPVGLVTAGARAIVEPQIERLGLGERIRVRVFGDEQPEQKPDPAPLVRALRELGLEAAGGRIRDDIAYVGDAPDDMRMAKAAGVRAIGVVSELSDEALLREAGADIVVPSVAVWVAELLGAARVHASVPAGGSPLPQAGFDRGGS